ncbi:MAG: hypothetical protein JNJ73_13145 [Hyphomonadaceae bacterium]|nr:hypothetical protein [Hyphomonadaceae bacterium]
MTKRRRYFFHSFPRPQQGETRQAHHERALKILAFMIETGLVLAPEVVSWDTSGLGHKAQTLDLLQRRACFTELSRGELRPHMATFGPISLRFDIAGLRSVGLMPVQYAPQAVGQSLFSQISLFMANSAWHTREVLQRLQEMKQIVDPAWVQQTYGKPLDPNCELTLNNTDDAGNVVAGYKVPASTINDLMKHIGFGNIPFDHSVGMLDLFLSTLYPTDNTHTSELLGYYRQREWRLIAGDMALNGRPLGRGLNAAETARLRAINPHFWGRDLTFKEQTSPRYALAQVYDPAENWSFFNLVQEVIAPKDLAEQIKPMLEKTSARLSTRRNIG